MFSAQGFTLIELLVVVAIMGVLGVITVGYGNFGENQKLNIATADIQSLLKLAQTNAATRVNCTSDGGGNGAIWWVEFAMGRKTVTTFCDNDMTTPSTTQAVNTYTLDSSLEISAISGGSSACSSGFPNNEVRIYFEPLYATVSFVDCQNSHYLLITVKNNKTTDTANSKQVKIDKGGSISVQ